jgi:uncharacterized protein with PQ loop repeat
MKEEFPHALIFLYGIAGFITLLAFIPTMIDLWKKKER